MWEQATFKERHQTVASILDAVYVDLLSKSVVGLLPKRHFYAIFSTTGHGVS